MEPRQLIGHRGYPARYPENTGLGFEQALAAGALNLEADVQLSADRVPIIFHDRNLLKLCGYPGVIHRCSSAQLTRLSPFDPLHFGTRFKGVPLLTLDRLVELLVAHPEVTLYLEIKRIALKAFGVRGVLDAILPRLAPIAERTVLISFSLFVLWAARDRGWPRLGPVLTRWEHRLSPGVQRLTPEVIFFNQRKFDSNVVYSAASPSLALYETSDLKRARFLLSQGASLIETDAIGELLAELNNGRADQPTD